MVKKGEVKALGSVVDILDALQEQFRVSDPGYTIISLVLSKGVGEGAITFTWNPDNNDYDVTIGS